MDQDVRFEQPEDDMSGYHPGDNGWGRDKGRIEEILNTHGEKLDRIEERVNGIEKTMNEAQGGFRVGRIVFYGVLSFASMIIGAWITGLLPSREAKDQQQVLDALHRIQTSIEYGRGDEAKPAGDKR